MDNILLGVSPFLLPTWKRMQEQSVVPYVPARNKRVKTTANESAKNLTPKNLQKKNSWLG
jgi:hypothetical protein